MNCLQRWRHSRGYGVHSPFGYEVVTRAVRPGRDYAWYGYRDIRNAMGHHCDRSVERQAKMLLRLIAMLRPEAVFLPHGAHPAYHAAINSADSRIEILRKASQIPQCQLICSYEEFLPLHTLCSFLSTPGNWITIRNIPSGWAEQLFSALPEGVMFRGKRNVIAIHRPGMMKQLYPLSI